MKKCYVILNENCSSDCTFCISKSRDYKNKLNFPSNNPFLKNEEDILNVLKLKGINNFEITGGGEPFLATDLNIKVALIKKIIPNAFIKIYTNGNHLREIAGIDELNISIAHYDDEINKSIMRPKSYVPLLDKLNYFKKAYPNSRIRLSVPLLKEGMNSEEDIKKLISLTEDFDIYYVIRTIYPQTPDFNSKYVDVNYKHARITYDRDNDISKFKEVIWWSNNELYANWSLQEKKYLFSYLLLKPDAQTYLDEVLNKLEEKDIAYYARLYQDINKIIYLYRDKPLDQQKIISTHLKALSLLYGPQFLVLFINNLKTPLSIEDAVLEAYKIKQEIRTDYSFSFKNNGTINYEGYNIQANIVHAPDFYGEQYVEDIKYLDHDLEYETLNPKTLSLARKYRTFKL